MYIIHSNNRLEKNTWLVLTRHPIDRDLDMKYDSQEQKNTGKIWLVDYQ